MRDFQAASLEVSFDIEELLSVLGTHAVNVAILYGSQARGDWQVKSDVDLAIEFEDHRPGDSGYNDLFLGLIVELERSLGDKAVDLVDINSVGPDLGHAIISNGVILLGDPERIALFRERIAEARAKQPSHRERLAQAVAKINATTDDQSGVPVTGNNKNEQ